LAGQNRLRKEIDTTANNPKIVIKEYIMTIRLRKSIQFKEL